MKKEVIILIPYTKRTMLILPPCYRAEVDKRNFWKHPHPKLDVNQHQQKGRPCKIVQMQEGRAKTYLEHLRQPASQAKHQLKFSVLSQHKTKNWKRWCIRSRTNWAARNIWRNNWRNKVETTALCYNQKLATSKNHGSLCFLTKIWLRRNRRKDQMPLSTTQM